MSLLNGDFGVLDRFAVESVSTSLSTQSNMHIVLPALKYRSALEQLLLQIIDLVPTIVIFLHLLLEILNLVLELRSQRSHSLFEVDIACAVGLKQRP